MESIYRDKLSFPYHISISTTNKYIIHNAAKSLHGDGRPE